MRAANEFDLRMTELAASERGRPAVIFAEHGRTVSYGELAGLTGALRQALMSSLPDTRPACILADSTGGIDAYLSLVAALRCPVPVAVRSRLDHDRSVDRLIGAGVAVLDASQPERLYLPSPDSERAGKRLPPHALVLPTGGTSGGGRQVIDVRMRVVSSQPRPLRLTSVLGWRPGPVQMMASLPPHASAMAFFLEGLTDGNTIVVPSGFQATTFLELIDEHQLEWLQATPFHLRMMQRADNGSASLKSLRALVHMSARCADDLKRYWIGRLGPERVYETYGSTEGIGATAVSGTEWLRRPGTVGKGFFTKVRIVGADGEIVPPGVQGLVYTSTGRRGAPVYLNQQEQLRRSADGLVSVGDEGWLDSDGYLYLAPRSLSRITVAGETFDAEDLEDALCHHPRVTDAGVCAVETGEDRVTVTALVVPDGQAFSESDLRPWLRARVPAAIVPRRVFCVDGLPRDGAGKMSRGRLLALAQQLARVKREAA